MRDGAEFWLQNFCRMGLTFSVCEALNAFVVGLATSALDARVATVGTGTLFLATVVSALTLGPPVVHLLGTKLALFVGLAFEVLFLVLFLIAVRQERASSSQWGAYMLGALCSGAGSGVAWTAQGAFFAQSAVLVAGHGSPPEPPLESAASVPPPVLAAGSDDSCLPCTPSAQLGQLGLDGAGRGVILTRSVTETIGRRDSFPARMSRAFSADSILSAASAGSLCHFTPLMTMPFSAFVPECAVARSELGARCHAVSGGSIVDAVTGVVAENLVAAPSSGTGCARTPDAPSLLLHASLRGLRDRSADVHLEQEKSAHVSRATSAMAARFAATLLLMDVVVKTLFSLLQGSFLQWRFQGAALLSFDGVLTLFVAMATVAVGVLLAAVRQPLLQGSFGPDDVSDDTTCRALRSAFCLWSLPELWLIGLTNLTFGLCSGYMNGVVNGTFATQSPSFGQPAIGTLMALTSLLAAGCSLLANLLAQRTGKGFVLALGGMSFACIPLSILLHPPRAANGYWHLWLLLLYISQGFGRSVYEGTNRAVFAEFFPAERGTGAFANCMMQSGSAFFASFLLQSTLERSMCDRVVAYSVVTLAALTAPCFAAARCFAVARVGPRVPLLVSAIGAAPSAAGGPVADGAWL